jgi:hypothetical protein
MATRYQSSKSEAVNWRTDNTMVTRYQSSNQKLIYYFGVLWPLYCLSFNLRLLIYYFGILWPLYCLSFNIRLLITTFVSCGHCIVGPSIYGFSDNTMVTRHQSSKSEDVNWRTDNTMATRYRSSNQKPYIEGQTIQWSQDTKVVIRSRKLKTIVLSVLQLTASDLLLWYLVAIVLSVLQFTASDYYFGVLWPLYCLSFNEDHIYYQ